MSYKMITRQATPRRRKVIHIPYRRLEEKPMNADEMSREIAEAMAREAEAMALRDESLDTVSELRQKNISLTKKMKEHSEKFLTSRFTKPVEKVVEIEKKVVEKPVKVERKPAEKKSVGKKPGKVEKSVGRTTQIIPPKRVTRVSANR